MVGVPPPGRAIEGNWTRNQLEASGVMVFMSEETEAFSSTGPRLVGASQVRPKPSSQSSGPVSVVSVSVIVGSVESVVGSVGSESLESVPTVSVGSVVVGSDDAELSVEPVDSVPLPVPSVGPAVPSVSSVSPEVLVFPLPPLSPEPVDSPTRSPVLQATARGTASRELTSARMGSSIISGPRGRRPAPVEGFITCARGPGSPGDRGRGPAPRRTRSPAAAAPASATPPTA